MTENSDSNTGTAHNILAIVGQGFEDVELAIYTDLAGWTRSIAGVANIHITIAGSNEVIQSCHGLRVLRDVSFVEAAEHHWDALVIPGGWPNSGYDELYQEPVSSLIRKTYQQGGLIATSCTGIFTVGEAGLLQGVRATTYVSPGGCCECTGNADRLAGYGAIVTHERIVSDQRIFSDIGPTVGIQAVFQFFAYFIGEEGVRKIQKELQGSHPENQNAAKGAGNRQSSDIG